MPASTNPEFTDRNMWNTFRVCGRDDQRGMVAACACRKSKPDILVVQPAENWAAKNVPGPLDGARDRRTIAMPADTNPAGDIFKGWLMSQMDMAAGSVATRRTRGRCATIAVDAITFLSPVFVGDEVTLYAELILRRAYRNWTQFHANQGRGMATKPSGGSQTASYRGDIYIRRDRRGSQTTRSAE